jgi:hypothetical protein
MDTCEPGAEPSGFIKYEAFFGKLGYYNYSKIALFHGRWK